jgi:hypothetical protein
MNKLGFDPIKITGELDHMSKAVGNKLMNVSDKVINSKILNPEKAVQMGTIEGPATTQIVNNTKKEAAETTLPEAIVQKIIHEHKFEFITRENALDPIKRYWLGDPELHEEVKNSYIATLNK